jgi:hypothetical protein
MLCIVCVRPVLRHKDPGLSIHTVGRARGWCDAMHPSAAHTATGRFMMSTGLWSACLDLHLCGGTTLSCSCCKVGQQVLPWH